MVAFDPYAISYELNTPSIDKNLSSVENDQDNKNHPQYLMMKEVINNILF